MSEIIITIKPNGEATVEADGIKGSQCSLHTRPFIAALGDQIKQTAKPEMFEEATAQELEVVS